MRDVHATRKRRPARAWQLALVLAGAAAVGMWAVFTVGVPAWLVPLVPQGPGASAHLSPAPSLVLGASVLSGPDVYPLSWSPDGSKLLVADQTPARNVLRVLMAEGRELWAHDGYDAAWTGPDTLAVVEADPADPQQGRLFMVTVSSGATTALKGLYRKGIVAALTGRLAVPTRDFPRPAFAILNPSGPRDDGLPLAWDPSGTLLAVGLGSAPMRTVELELISVATGTTDRTGLQISPNGTAFDRSGRALLVCVVGNASGECTPALIDVATKHIIRSSMSGELLDAGQLADGRWVGGNPTHGTRVWDPTDPARILAIGSGWPAVSAGGVVAIVDWLDARGPAVAANVQGVPLLHVTGPTSTNPLWSPAGDRLAYAVVTETGSALWIARLP